MRRLLFLVLAAISVAAAAAPPSSQRDPCVREPRPNLILILTDDQDLALGSMDSMQSVKSLLADRGATFTHFFVPLSLCCPARVSVLRGQYPHNHGVLRNEPPRGGFQQAYADGLESATLATALQAAGYRTFFFGKYLNHYPETASQTYIPPGWDEWYSPVGGTPYSEYNYDLNANGTVISYGEQPSDYMTDVLSAEAVRFVRAMAADPERLPFFMHLTPFAPHRPFTPAPRHAGLFPGVQAPRTPSFNEADVSDKPLYIRERPLLGEADIATLDKEYRWRLRSLQAVDEMVAAVVNELEAAGLLGETYIFFSSDNGFHMGQHRFASGKYTPYETDIRVPLVIRGPGVLEGAAVDAFAESVDLAPTLADLAGASLEATPDGRSLVPLLEGRAPGAWRQSVLLEQIAGAVSPTLREGTPEGQVEPPDAADLLMASDYPGHRGFRTGAYKYVEYDTWERELYFLDTDPDELDNRACAVNAGFLAAASLYLAPLGWCEGPGCLQVQGAVPPAPLSASFSRTPALPTDATPVTFSAAASGTPPYTFTWDLGGQAGEGPTVDRTFPPGTYDISLRVRDAAGASAAATEILEVAYSLAITSAKALTGPLRLRVLGGGFGPGCKVHIDGVQAPSTRIVSGSKAVAEGGGLKALLPRGVRVQVTVVSPDGRSSLPFPFTRR